MRRIIFISLLVLSFTSYAAVPSEFYDPDLLLDSIVSPHEQKNVYQFDRWGNITLEEAYQWSEQANDWQGMFKMILSFDQEGNETLYESYDWDPITWTWLGSVKSEYEYNNDKMVHATMYQFDRLTNGWLPYRDNYFAFDANGNDTYYEYNVWSDAKNAWVPESKYIYAYDDKNVLEMAESWIWSTDLEKWVGNYKVEKNHPGILNLRLSDYYIWNEADESWQIESIQEGSWNESHNCWTVTEYLVSGDEKEFVRSVLYYFNSQTQSLIPILNDNFIDPFESRYPMADGDLNAKAFDLQGKMIPLDKLREMPKGIYILNGKKIMK